LLAEGTVMYVSFIAEGKDCGLEPSDGVLCSEPNAPLLSVEPD